MRALIFSCLFSKVLFGISLALANPGTVRLDYTSIHSRVGSTIGIGGSSPASSGADGKISAMSSTLPAGFRIGASYAHQEGKNDAFLVAPPDLGGTQVPLSALESGQRTRGGIQVEQELGGMRWSLLHEQDLSRSLVAEKYYEGSLRYGEASDLTSYGIEFQRRHTDQPANRFVHPLSFRSIDRPAVLHEERNDLFVERILDESWRARLILHQGRVAQTRPVYAGLEIRQSFALGRIFFPQLILGHLAEGRGDPFEDDRGDTVHDWIDVGVSAQVSGRSLLKIAVSLAREEELRRPGFGDARAQIAAVTLGWDYRLGNQLFVISARAAGGDRGYAERTLQGGMTWEFGSL